MDAEALQAQSRQANPQEIGADKKLATVLAIVG